MRKRLIAICLMTTFCLLVAQPAMAAPESRFSATISPEMELLAGVLAQTSWIKNRGPQGRGNEYFQALQDHFAPFQEHAAVKIAQELTTAGFTYDAPVAFICHLGSLPELDLQYEYSSYLIERARGRDKLEGFRTALIDLAQEADFLDFYQSWQPRFAEWLAAAEFDGDMVVNWLEQFFGQEAAEFHLILAPAIALMALPLYKGALDDIAGAFHYDPVFDINAEEAEVYNRNFPHKEPVPMLTIDVLLNKLDPHLHKAFSNRRITALATLNRFSGREMLTWEGIDEHVLTIVNETLLEHGYAVKLFPSSPILQRAKEGRTFFIIS